MRTAHFPIGVLSAQTGVNIETIRYYEKIKLMPAPPRSDGGQRVYDGEHLKRLIFIRRSRELGFSLDQIRNLLGLTRGHKLTCAEVKDMADAHIAGIRQKVKDLKRLEHVLGDLAARCNGKKIPNCPILEALASGKTGA